MLFIRKMFGSGTCGWSIYVNKHLLIDLIFLNWNNDFLLHWKMITFIYVFRMCGWSSILHHEI